MTRRTHRWWHGIDAAATAAATPAEGAAPDLVAPAPSAATSDLGATGVPDPWADRLLAAASLTADQRDVLAGLDDQPDGPRLDGLEAADEPGAPTIASGDQPAIPRLRPGAPTRDATGNLPGDQGGGLPYRRTRWTRPERET